MGFFQTARRAGAEEYGKARAEKYGRQERWFRIVIALAVVAFLFYCWTLGK